MMPWLIYEVEMKMVCCFIAIWIGKHELYDWLFMHDVGIYMNFLIGWWNLYKVWVGRNSMTLVVRAHGGAPPNGRNSMGPPEESLVAPHLLDLNPWTSRWEFMMVPQRQDVIPRGQRGGVSRPGRNFTKATWWCLAART